MAQKVLSSYENREHKILQRWFNGLEVVEARAELRIQPNEEDIAKGVPADPFNCPLAQCIKRMWGSSVIVFLGGIAYIDLLNPKDGIRRVERFILSSSGRKFVASVDNREEVDPNGFILLPPSASQTIEARRGQKTRSIKRRRAALMKGESASSRGAARPKKKPNTVRVSALRDGRGMVHFVPARQNEEAAT